MSDATLESGTGYHRVLPQSNDRAGLLAMGVIFTLLTIAVTAARFYSRRLNKANYGADDWLALAALISLVGLNVTFIAGTAQGALTGHSQIGPKGPITSDLEHLVQKYKYAFQIIEKITFGLIKLSILFLWIRIFGTVRSFAIAAWVMIGLCIIWTVAFLFATIFQCGTEFYQNWTPIFESLAHCTQIPLLTGFVATDLLTDIIILIMPMPMIWRLQMNKKKKVGFTATFLVGLLTIGAGIARMYIYLAINYDKEDNPDFIADFTLFILWSDIEANVAMIVCCMPTLIPFVRKVRSSVLYATRQTSLSRWNLLSDRSSKKHSSPHEVSGFSDRGVTPGQSAASGRDRYNAKMGYSETTVSHSTVDDDIEMQLQHPKDGIVVQRDMTNTYESSRR